MTASMAFGAQKAAIPHRVSPGSELGDLRHDVEEAFQALETEVGNHTSLNTADKTNLVAAINEVLATGVIGDHADGGASKHDATEIDYERLDASKKNIAGGSDTVEAAITNLDDATGALSALATTDKTSVVAAINEVRTTANAAVVAADLASIANAKGASLIGIEDVATKLAAANVEAALAELATDHDNLVTDLASVVNAKGASLIGVEDSAGKTAATTVEAVLAELLANLNGAKIRFGVKDLATVAPTQAQLAAAAPDGLDVASDGCIGLMIDTDAGNGGAGRSVYLCLGHTATGWEYGAKMALTTPA